MLGELASAALPPLCLPAVERPKKVRRQATSGPAATERRDKAAHARAASSVDAGGEDVYCDGDSTDVVAGLPKPVPEMVEFSPRGQAMVAALNAPSGLRIDQASDRLGSRIDGVTTRVTAIEQSARRQAGATTAQFEAIRLRLQTVETGRGNAPSAGGDPWAQGWANYRAGGACSSKQVAAVLRQWGYPESVRSAAGSAPGGGGTTAYTLTGQLRPEYTLPTEKRRILAVGGFPRNTDPAQIQEKLTAIQVEFPRITHGMPSGLYNSVGKTSFRNE